uniref:Uncharacterized protein n=1 Tax=Glypta fumiferanae TaxID=389681 RepID=A0A0F6T1C7_9HYME|nr:hypothetical protein [Glypta fumiferanae]
MNPLELLVEELSCLETLSKNPKINMLMEQNNLRDNMICQIFETLKFRNGVVFDRNSVHEAIEKSAKVKRLLASRIAQLHALLSSSLVMTSKTHENLCAIRLLLRLHKHLQVEIDRSSADRLLDILKDISTVAPNSVVDDIRKKYYKYIVGFTPINRHLAKMSFPYVTTIIDKS